MENSIDKLTLELLINKQQYSKYLSKADPKKYDEFKEYKSKLRKYSVDIMDMTSQLIENPNHPYSVEIEESFNTFSKSIFRYFEMKELEKSNEYNQDYKKDEDMMFAHCETPFLEDAENESDNLEETPPKTMRSFWGGHRVVKQKSTILPYDIGVFAKKQL
jgi:FtsZ-interacting cell division protein YlmF